jgi:hypothetical protein
LGTRQTDTSIHVHNSVLLIGKIGILTHPILIFIVLSGKEDTKVKVREVCKFRLEVKGCYLEMSTMSLVCRIIHFPFIGL